MSNEFYEEAEPAWYTSLASLGRTPETVYADCQAKHYKALLSDAQEFEDYYSLNDYDMVKDSILDIPNIIQLISGLGVLSYAEKTGNPSHRNYDYAFAERGRLISNLLNDAFQKSWQEYCWEKADLLAENELKELHYEIS